MLDQSVEESEEEKRKLACRMACGDKGEPVWPWRTVCGHGTCKEGECVCDLGWSSSGPTFSGETICDGFKSKIQVIQIICLVVASCSIVLNFLRFDRAKKSGKVIQKSHLVGLSADLIQFVLAWALFSGMGYVGANAFPTFLWGLYYYLLYASVINRVAKIQKFLQRQQGKTKRNLLALWVRDGPTQYVKFILSGVIFWVLPPLAVKSGYTGLIRASLVLLGLSSFLTLVVCWMWIRPLLEEFKHFFELFANARGLGDAGNVLEESNQKINMTYKKAHGILWSSITICILISTICFTSAVNAAVLRSSKYFVCVVLTCQTTMKSFTALRILFLSSKGKRRTVIHAYTPQGINNVQTTQLQSTQTGSRSSMLQMNLNNQSS